VVTTNQALFQLGAFVEIANLIRRVIEDNDPYRTSGPANLGTLIADALADAGLAQLDGGQVADYIRSLGDHWAEKPLYVFVDAVTEAIEEDLDDEEEI
jgi:hypothetical protein